MKMMSYALKTMHSVSCVEVLTTCIMQCALGAGRVKPSGEMEEKLVYSHLLTLSTAVPSCFNVR